MSTSSSRSLPATAPAAPPPAVVHPTLGKLGREIQSPGLQKLMTNFWVDKAGAMILVGQAVWSMFDAVQNHEGLEMYLWLASQVLMVGFAVFRATPKRVTTNPVNWFIEAAAFCSWFLYWTVRNESAIAIAPKWVSSTIAIIGLFILVGARLSLARSFGYLPAQREIRVVGTYAFVRHPIYTAILFNGIALFLAHTSAMMAVAVFTNNFFFLLKALIEENYLGLHSPEYRAYMQRVRWRYIPYVF
ncbi:MAG TPA: hypothetical protein VFP84_37930 [Kofleriaceae bacterium]|nr:hypothetical protein [Kofleriaceae bacterium]